MATLSNKNQALISACLTGINCRYNGKNRLSKFLNIYKEKYFLVPVCPEQLGGLPTPRLKSEITEGDGFDVLNNKATVLNEKGLDVTKKFLKGAMETLNLCKILGIKIAFFKEKSPSCGVSKIYNNGSLYNGCGVTTAVLLKNNIKVFGVD